MIFGNSSKDRMRSRIGNEPKYRIENEENNVNNEMETE